jgi:hypothetical protein
MNEMKYSGKSPNLPDAEIRHGDIAGSAVKEDYLKKLTTPDKLLLAGALALGILFVWFFYGKLPGVSIPLFIFAFYVLLLVYARPVLKKEALFGWLLCIPVFMLSLTYLFFGSHIFRVLNLLMLPVLVLLQTLLITGANSFKWYSPGIIIDLIYGMLYRCLVHIAKPFGIFSVLLRKNTSENGTKSVAMRIGLGLLISLPLLLILLALLSSADMVFGNLVEKFSKLFETINISDLIGRIIAALAIFFLTFSYLWSVAHSEKMTESTLKSMPPPLALQKGFWDPVMILTITSVINILYIVFVVIQFAYLFGGAGLPDGFTYARYARSGFFELLFVTLLNIGLLACTLTFTKKGGTWARMAMRIMNTIMICCTVIMLFSAYYRMSLYEEAYGYTFLRITTQSFMVFLLVLFVITLARVWKDGLSLLKPYIAVAVVALVAVNYMNVDMLIVRKNMERYTNTKVIDIAYFSTLSSDAVVEIRSLAGDKNPEVAKTAKNLLQQRKAQLNKDRHWQSFNLVDYNASIKLRN